MSLPDGASDPVGATDPYIGNYEAGGGDMKEWDKSGCCLVNKKRSSPRVRAEGGIG